MKTLVYKRTHSGDPDEQGRFGVHDCMGGVRGWDYEAVIGVGGTGDEPRRWGIAEKLTWIGIGPHRAPGTLRGPLVTFDHFLYYGPKGPRLADFAPALAEHIYGLNVRTLMNFTELERTEVDSVLALARNAPPSHGRRDATGMRTGQCVPMSAGLPVPAGKGRRC